MSNIKQKKQDILDVMKYRSSEDSCNSVYVGSMATSVTINFLRGTYGEYSIEDLLEKANSKQVEDAWLYLEHYIKFMKKHPVIKCKSCGQIVSLK